MDRGAAAFTLDIQPAKDCEVLALSGELDVSTVGRLRNAVEELVREGASRVVIDATRLTFMDSSGLGALVMAQRKMRVLQGAVTVAVNRDGPVARVIFLTGLQHVLRLFDTVEEAVLGLDPAAHAADDELSF